MGEEGPKVQTPTYKINIMGCNVQHGDHVQRCYTYSEVVNVKVFNNKKIL